MHSETIRIKGTENEVNQTIEELEQSHIVTVISELMGDKDHMFVTVSLKKKRR
jgi:hypothetical protein